MKKISIIIPIYNVEDLLPQCLDSVIDQTYHNLEIILDLLDVYCDVQELIAEN